MAYRILINREECEVRVAFLEEDQLVELHTEKFDDQTIVNNLYRGRVQDVVPGLQAAFVDVGLERNMFLHFMDIRPESLVLSSDDALGAIREASKKSMPGRIEQRGRRPRQDPNAPQAAPPVKRGDEIIVQVMKDEISGKAPRVTTNLSLAGRYLVMLPFPSQEGGVSRKIAVGQDRFRLKKILAGLKTEDHSFIVRTAGLEQPEEAIRNDAETLEKLWDKILSEYDRIGGPGLLNNDHDLIVRLVRDAFPPDFNEVVCDDSNDAEAVRVELARLMPEKEKAVKVFQGEESLFDHFSVEKQIEQTLDRKYWLKSGGSLVIDEDEALTAIDVNTGRFTGKRDQEKTSLKTNIEACEAIARQIRLRDIGGIIVIDFIDMLSRANQERVSEELRRQLKNDRAKTAIGRIGDFGLMVLTRKRQRMSLLKQVTQECPYCNGKGVIHRADEIFRRLKYEILRVMNSESGVSGVVISAHPKLIDTLTSRFLRFFEKLKKDSSLQVVYQADPEYHMEDFQITPMRRPTEEDTLRLPEERTPAEKRVLPAIIDYVTVVKEEKEEEAEKDPASAFEELKEEAVDPEEVESEEESEEARGNRRRRESSADRRARRRRARTRESDEPEGDEEKPAEPAVEKKEQAESAADKKEEEEQEESSRRRTRRGTRGGRGRRKREEEPAASKAAEPEVQAPVTASPEPPKLAEPLTLKLPKKRSEEADLLESFLNKIEEEVKTMKSEPAAKKADAPVKAEKARKEPAKAEEKPAAKKTSRRRTTKKAEEPKPKVAGAEEKPKKTTRRKTTTTKPAAKSEGAKPKAEEKKAATRQAPKKKPAEEKAPKAAATSTAKKATTRRKAATKKAGESTAAEEKTKKPATRRPRKKKEETE